MSGQNFEETLEIERIFDAPVERVYDAWTKPQMLMQWFGPEGFEVTNTEIDFKLGGRYSITIKSPDDNIIVHFGEYLEIDKPNKLTFTWILKNQSCEGSAGKEAVTLVEINFVEQKNKTLLRLTHEKLPDRTALDGHRFGWQSSLKSLHFLLET